MARRPTLVRRAPRGEEAMIPCRIWFKNLSLEGYHRVGGPAIESSDGTKEWWLDGIHLRIESDWQVYDTDAGLRQQIKDLEQRVMELEEKLSLDAGTGV